MAARRATTLSNHREARAFSVQSVAGSTSIRNMGSIESRPFWSNRRTLLVLHLGAVLLACTSWTLITGPFTGHFSWSFFSYAYADGWGYSYRSDYTLAEAATYLVAYASGFASYRWSGSGMASRLALLICGLGVVSFSIELSHWIFEHNLCLIASFPILLLLIGGWTLISGLIYRVRARHPAHPEMEASRTIRQIA